MKPHTLETTEGPEAFRRFQKAMKAIVSVRKDQVLAADLNAHPKKKKPTNNKS